MKVNKQAMTWASPVHVGMFLNFGQSEQFRPHHDYIFFLIYPGNKANKAHSKYDYLFQRSLKVFDSAPA